MRRQGVVLVVATSVRMVMLILAASGGAQQAASEGPYKVLKTAKVCVFSHWAPNATVINAADGSIAGTIDLGGAPEQAVTDGKGHLYVDIEDKHNIAVVDAKTMTVTAHYDLAGKCGVPRAGADGDIEFGGREKYYDLDRSGMEWMGRRLIRRRWKRLVRSGMGR